ncbi:peptidylprolyl isomerase [Mesorhizobium sp. Pch-S]|jgi:parvulin-like peptidyl-prolyl isomerase|uniref:peptidylprolyl isomerase n=1 Tax=Mesorhizobium sp. Pch-S TaxID=2082387 RepID=UPI001FDEF103|nr:peptidylprolyl isomerase [Mesorhizobium sp. Pch-S]
MKTEAVTRGPVADMQRQQKRRYPWRLATLAAGGLLIGSVGLALAQNNATTSRPKSVAPAAAKAASGDDIVARVGERDITIEEVRASLAGLGPERQAALTRDPAALSQTIRLLLASQLVLKEANDKKWADQPAVAAQLASLRDSAVAESYLQAVSVPPESYPADADVQQAYEANKTAFVVPRQFRLAQIFVALEPDADKAKTDLAKKKLADVQSRLKPAQADFAAIAKELSDQRDTAESGGEIGWVAETQVRPEIKDHVMGLSKNGLSEPIKLDDGWHIIKLMDTKASTTRLLDEVKPLLVQRLREQRQEVLKREYLARLLEQNPPAINELALSKVFSPAPAN